MALEREPLGGLYQVWNQYTAPLLKSGLKWGLGTVLVFAGLMAWNAECMWLPPYEDQAVGLWTEAAFLDETGFDYYRLRYAEPHFMDENPGARSYMISIVPTLLAMLMRASPNVQTTIFAAHAITMACASAIAVIVFGVLKDRIGVVGAGLTSVALLATPAFRTQIQMVGLDIPLTLFCLLTALAVWRERYFWAAAFSFVAFLVKATGALLTMATLVYLLARLAWRTPGNNHQPLRTLVLAIVVHLVLLALQTAIVLIGDESVAIFDAIEWPRVFSLPYLVYWAPDLVVVFVAATILSLASLATAVSHIATARENRMTALRTALGHSWHNDRVVWYSWIVCLGMVSSSSLLIWIPRYLTCAIPFLYFILATQSFSIWPGRRAAIVCFIFLIAFQLANARGRFLKPIADVDRDFFRSSAYLHPRSCPFTERSLEYQQDQASIRAAITLLEREATGVPVLIAIPYRFWWNALARRTFNTPCPRLPPSNSARRSTD